MQIANQLRPSTDSDSRARQGAFPEQDCMDGTGVSRPHNTSSSNETWQKGTFLVMHARLTVASFWPWCVRHGIIHLMKAWFGQLLLQQTFSFNWVSHRAGSDIFAVDIVCFDSRIGASNSWKVVFAFHLVCWVPLSSSNFYHDGIIRWRGVHHWIDSYYMQELVYERTKHDGKPHDTTISSHHDKWKINPIFPLLCIKVLRAVALPVANSFFN